MKLCIRNGYVLSPANNIKDRFDILIEDGIITGIEEPGGVYSEDLINIDATDRWVIPGLIDLHVHFREPGYSYKEDIKSGSEAASRGGFTTVCCMPNTDPPIDSPETVLYVDKRGSSVNLLPIAAVSKGQDGCELNDIDELVKLHTRCFQLMGKGICAISEDGKTVIDTELMQLAMQRAKSLDIPVFSHCEDHHLSGGTMRLGKRSKELNVQGIPSEAEAIIVARDILLAKNTGCRLHFCHISTKESIDLIRLAKSWGVKLTAETAPHYFTLTDKEVTMDNGLKKMNPPLGDEEDRKAIIDALKDGTIDAIATDHAPHHESEKLIPIEDSAFGVVGLETSFAIAYTNLVRTGILTPNEIVDKMSTRPAEILGVDRGIIEVGKVADLTVIDIESEYTIDPKDFVSKGKNTPFTGMKVFGKVVDTLVDGKVIYHDRSFDR